MNWRRLLLTYAFLLASLSTLALGVALVGMDQTLTRQQILSAVGLNLIGSVVFALFFVSISGRVQDRAIREHVEQSFDELSSALIAQLAHHGRSFLPVAAYEPTGEGEFGDRYNADLMKSLAFANSTSFYSRTGWYLPARLGILENRHLTVRLVILDPVSTAFDMFARDELKRTWARGLSFEQCRDLLEGRFFQVVAALFALRHDHTITIALHRDVSTYRYQITDDSLYISWLRTEESYRRFMPASHRFDRAALLYIVFEQEMNRRFQVVTEFAAFRDSDPESKLQAALNDVWERLNERRRERGAPPRPAISDANVSEWRAQYAAACTSFVDHISAWTSPAR